MTLGVTTRIDERSEEAVAGPSRRGNEDVDAVQDAQTQLASFSFGGTSVSREAVDAATSSGEGNGGIRSDFRFGSYHPDALSVPARPSPLSSRSASYTHPPAIPIAAANLAATPTIEYGAFEYPTVPSDPASPSASARALPPAPGLLRGSRGSIESPISPVSYPLGESYRRNSVIARSYAPTSASASSSARHTPSASLTSPPSPPLAKRSITCSEVPTVPASGRRPSILHSATMAAGEDVPALPMLHTDTAAEEQTPSERPGLVHLSSSSSSTATLTGPTINRSTSIASSTPASPATHAFTSQARRRTSLMFQPKALPSPVPPSLLARRGSLPGGAGAGGRGTSGGVEGHGRRAELLRASFSGLQTYGGLRDVTSHRLYHRKESLALGPAAPQVGAQGLEAGRKSLKATSRQGDAERAEVALVGPGLEAVPAEADFISPSDSGATRRTRRASVPHSLRSTIRPPAHIGSAAEAAILTVDTAADDARSDFRTRYASYDRAYRPAFSRNLSSSDESDELLLSLEHPEGRRSRGSGGSGEEEGGETDEVESLPTPDLDVTLARSLGMGIDAAPDRVRLDHEEEGGPGGGMDMDFDTERPGLEERGSDETVKSVDGLQRRAGRQVVLDTDPV